MSALSSPADPVEEDLHDRIATAIEANGYVLIPDALPAALIDALFVDLTSRQKAGFSEAGVGRDTLHTANPLVRTDRTCWIDRQHAATAVYLDWIEHLRLSLNRRLFLGLFDYECHFANYPPGAFYRKHLDAFKGEAVRILSVILYLNPAWNPGDGGELILYDPDTGVALPAVAPLYGHLVIFLSEHFPHEVTTTNKSRYSLTGWFRLNGAAIP